MDQLKAAHLRALSLQPDRPRPAAPPRTPAAVPLPAPRPASVPQIDTANTARAAKPIHRLVFDLVNHLKKTGRHLTIAEILRDTGIDINANPALLSSLRVNPKVNFADGLFSYKAKHDLSNKDEVLDLITRMETGIDKRELLDAYIGVEEDIQKLIDEKKVFVMKNTDTKAEILYPNDPNYVMNVSPEIQGLWRATPIPNEFNLERDMKEAGLTVMQQEGEDPASRKRKAQTKEKKKPKKTRTHKFMNVHVQGLFPPR